MTEEQKQRQLILLEQRAVAAEKSGLHSTAKSWRDYAYSVCVRPAREIVFVDRGEQENPSFT